MRALLDRTRDTLLAPALDALSAHVAVLDEAGVIIHVNRAWARFGAENGLEDPLACRGVNYIAVCEAADRAGDPTAHAVAEGLRRVLAGELREFELEYPCHAPGMERWFVVRAVDPGTDPRLALVIHENVTARKLADGYAAERTVARGVARRLLGAIDPGSVHAQEKRELGRAIARDLGLTTMTNFLDAFAAMGLGEVRVVKGEGGKFTFEAVGLVESRAGGTLPSCNVTLGFLEGALAAVSGGDTLGAEPACESQGSSRCTFVVQVREASSDR